MGHWVTWPSGSWGFGNQWLLRSLPTQAFLWCSGVLGCECLCSNGCILGLGVCNVPLLIEQPIFCNMLFYKIKQESKATTMSALLVKWLTWREGSPVPGLSPVRSFSWGVTHWAPSAEGAAELRPAVSYSQTGSLPCPGRQKCLMILF